MHTYLTHVYRWLENLFISDWNTDWRWFRYVGCYPCKRKRSAKTINRYNEVISRFNSASGNDDMPFFNQHRSTTFWRSSWCKSKILFHITIFLLRQLSRPVTTDVLLNVYYELIQYYIILHIIYVFGINRLLFLGFSLYNAGQLEWWQKRRIKLTVLIFFLFKLMTLVALHHLWKQSLN